MHASFIRYRIGPFIALALSSAGASAQAPEAAPLESKPAPTVPAGAAPEPTANATAPAAPEASSPADPKEPSAATLLPKVRRAPPAPPAMAQAVAVTEAAALDRAEPAQPAPETPFIDAWLGVHGTVVSSPGFDAFSNDDLLTAFSAGVGIGGIDLGAARLAAVASVSLSGADSSLRGQATELSVLLLSLGPELRLPVASRFYLYGRVSPLAVRAQAQLEDASSFTTLEQDEWQFGAEAAAGAALRFAEARPSALGGPVCFYLRLEGGYSAVAAAELELAPAGANAPLRSERLSLGELSLSGASFRTVFGVGY